MKKEKSIEFLQSCIDKVKNASEEDIAFYKHRLEEDSAIKKSVLVLDTPETCLDCMFCFELDEGVNACCSVMSDENDKSLCRYIQCDGGYCQGKPDWCPLKELPERRKYDEEFFNGEVKGWNSCLKKIIGEKCNKPYPTIGDLIKDKDYDYISYRLTMIDKSQSFFAGCFKSESGKIISLDGDVYGLDEEVLRYEEWSNPEEGIYKGLTVVVDYELELVIRKTKERIKNKC